MKKLKLLFSSMLVLFLISGSALAQNLKIYCIDIYHVSHHGADTSSCTSFLNATTPEVCIISNGSHGNHKHPRRATVERLENTSSIQHIYQTNKSIKWDRYPGTVKNTPDEFIGDLDSDGDKGTILIEVESNTYKVIILDRNMFDKLYVNVIIDRKLYVKIFYIKSISLLFE